MKKLQHLIESMVREILSEGRFEDAQKKYPEAAEVLSWAKERDMKPKYIDWFLARFKETNGFETTAADGLTATRVIVGLKTFDELAKRKAITPSDIGAYKTLEEMTDAVLEAGWNEKIKQEEKNKGKDADVIYRDDNYLVVRPNTEKASCKYGKGTQWCISATESENLFKTYTQRDNAVFYFFIDRKSNDKDALTILPGKDPVVFDASDEEYPLNYLFGKYPIDVVRAVFAKVGLDANIPENVEEFNTVIQNPVAKLTGMSVMDAVDYFRDVESVLGWGGKTKMLVNLIAEFSADDEQMARIILAVLDREELPETEVALKTVVANTTKMLASPMSKHFQEFLVRTWGVYAFFLAKGHFATGLPELAETLRVAHILNEAYAGDGPGAERALGIVFEKFSEYIGKSDHVTALIESNPKVLVDLIRVRQGNKMFWFNLDATVENWASAYVAQKTGLDRNLISVFMLHTAKRPIMTHQRNNMKYLAKAVQALIPISYIERISDETAAQLAELYGQSNGDFYNLLPPDFANAVKSINESLTRAYFAKFLKD